MIRVRRCLESRGHTSQHLRSCSCQLTQTLPAQLHHSSYRPRERAFVCMSEDRRAFSFWTNADMQRSNNAIVTKLSGQEDHRTDQLLIRDYTRRNKLWSVDSVDNMSEAKATIRYPT